jgi:hypothetical protein
MHAASMKRIPFTKIMVLHRKCIVFTVTNTSLDQKKQTNSSMKKRILFFGEKRRNYMKKNMLHVIKGEIFFLIKNASCLEEYVIS